MEEVCELDDTSRGASGFGISGIRLGQQDSSRNGSGKNLMKEDMSTQIKSQDSGRLNSLKRLSGSNKPHILSQTAASK